MNPTDIVVWNGVITTYSLALLLSSPGDMIWEARDKDRRLYLKNYYN